MKIVNSEVLDVLNDIESLIDCIKPGYKALHLYKCNNCWEDHNLAEVILKRVNELKAEYVAS